MPRFDTRLATKNTGDLSEGSNLYYTEARWDARLAQKTTDNITEGSSNLFFTNERTDDRVAALIQNGTGITWTYDDTSGTLTGVVSFRRLTLRSFQNLVIYITRMQEQGPQYQKTLLNFLMIPLLVF